MRVHLGRDDGRRHVHRRRARVVDDAAHVVVEVLLHDLAAVLDEHLERAHQVHGTLDDPEELVDLQLDVLQLLGKTLAPVPVQTRRPLHARKREPLVRPRLHLAQHRAVDGDAVLAVVRPRAAGQMPRLAHGDHVRDDAAARLLRPRRLCAANHVRVVGEQVKQHLTVNLLHAMHLARLAVQRLHVVHKDLAGHHALVANAVTLRKHMDEAVAPHGRVAEHHLANVLRAVLVEHALKEGVQLLRFPLLAVVAAAGQEERTRPVARHLRDHGVHHRLHQVVADAVTQRRLLRRDLAERHARQRRRRQVAVQTRAHDPLRSAKRLRVADQVQRPADGVRSVLTLEHPPTTLLVVRQLLRHARSLTANREVPKFNWHSASPPGA